MSKKGWEAALESGLKMSGESGPEKEMGWLMVAKYLPRCSEQEKRTLRSRISSRFTNACQTSHSLSSSLFVRAALAAFPAFRTLYKAQLDGYLDELLREAQENASDSLLERATRELWATNATTDRVDKASAVLREVVCEFGKNVEVSGLRANRGSLLLRLVADCVRHADRGSSMPCSLLDTLGAAMEKEPWRAEALRLLEAVVRAASWAVASNAKSLCQSLIRMSPSAELYNVLTALEETLGASSHIHAHLAIVFNALKHPLPAEYAEEAARLLETVFVRSGALVDPAVLSCVCSAICAAALRYRSSAATTRVYGKLVAALLCHGHDTAPVPVHIARTLVASMPPCEERSRLQLLADLVSRPRTYAMAPSLLMEETRRVRKEAAVNRLVRMEIEEEKEGGEMMEQNTEDDAAAAAAHHKEMIQMRVMEGEEKKGGKMEEEEEEIEVEDEEEIEKTHKKNGVHIQSRKEKKRAAKKRRSEEKYASASAKKQKTGEPKSQSKPSKEEKEKEEKANDQKKADEKKKFLTVPKTPLPPPPPITSDMQAVIDMAVLDFD